MDEYERRIVDRCAQLEEFADTIKQSQDSADRARKEARSEHHARIQELSAEAQALDDEIQVLAKSIKKFIASFRCVGMQSQLERIQERVDALSIDEWMTKKEFVSQAISSSYESRVRQERQQ